MSPIGLCEDITTLIVNRLYTGSEPTASLWEKLKQDGFKTVISVDGIRPDIETAEKNGISYIHLPIGYNEVSEERRQQLASALKHSKGPIYLHCHHGKHRGPAAAVIAALSNGAISQEEALTYLKEQETSVDYQGLWQAVRFSTPLKNIPEMEFSSYEPPGDLAETMAKLDRSWERVQKFRKVEWPTTLESHPDLVLSNELLLILEYLTESQRLSSTDENQRSGETQELHSAYTESLEAIKAFHTLSQDPSSQKSSLEKAYQKTSQSCKSCHANFRN